MLVVLICAIIAVAFLYSTVGHGGASGYIAVLALAGYSAVLIRQDALILNLLVSGVAFWNFNRKGHFSKSMLFPLIFCSVPMAFLGGMIQMDADWYKRILGALLLIPAFLFLLDMKPADVHVRKPSVLMLMGLGLTLGFISGLTGIGGGVFLSPILILGRWAGQKTTAAVSAAFIFVNSAAGLAGTLNHSRGLDENVWFFAMAALAGGLAGASLGAGRLNSFILKKILGFVLLLAALKLFFA